MKESVAVTVICACYNQAGYVRDALDGFIAQKTAFPFEVIVHDDASTDGTGEIVREYAERYPDVIVPVIQKENQDSQGIDIYKNHILPLVRGRYIARCEGDDYWIDEYKLQKQFDFLESHPDYAMVAHNAYVIDYAADIVFTSEPADADKDKTMQDIIREGGGLLNPTASLFHRVDLRGIDWRSFNAPIGDHFLMMSLTSQGKFHWMANPMSVYRYGSIGSFTSGTRTEDIESIENYTRRYVSALRAMDKATEGKYHDCFLGREAIQEKEAANRILISKFENGGSFGLLKNCSAKICLKALSARMLSDKGYARIRRAFFILKKRRVGTYVSGKAVDRAPLQIESVR